MNMVASMIIVVVLMKIVVGICIPALNKILFNNRSKDSKNLQSRCVKNVSNSKEKKILSQRKESVFQEKSNCSLAILKSICKIIQNKLKTLRNKFKTLVLRGLTWSRRWIIKSKTWELISMKGLFIYMRLRNITTVVAIMVVVFTEAVATRDPKDHQ